MSTDRLVTVHIEDVPFSSILDALLAIEAADMRGAYDEEQHRALTALVVGLRDAMDPQTVGRLEELAKLAEEAKP